MCAETDTTLATGATGTTGATTAVVHRPSSKRTETSVVEAVTCGASCAESSTPVTLLYDMEGEPTVPDGGFGNLPAGG